MQNRQYPSSCSKMIGNLAKVKNLAEIQTQGSKVYSMSAHYMVHCLCIERSLVGRGSSSLKAFSK